MKTVLVAIDGSKQSLVALRDFARRASGRVELVNVRPEFHWLVLRCIPKETREGWRELRARKVLIEGLGILREAGLECRGYMAAGPIGEAARTAARVTRADEVVMISRRSYRDLDPRSASRSSRYAVSRPSSANSGVVSGTPR